MSCDCFEGFKDIKICYCCGQVGYIFCDCFIGGDQGLCQGGGGGSFVECYKVSFCYLVYYSQMFVLNLLLVW